MGDERRIVLPSPLDHQLPVLLSPARHKVVVCGRRWGKSSVGLQACIAGHGPTRACRKGAMDGGKIWWVAPTYPIAVEMWRDIKRACARAMVDKSERERRIVLPGGGSVSVRSADDPGSLVGVGLDGVVIDEAAKVKPEAWYESLRPTLSDTGGWSLFIGTPKGHNWFWELFQAAGREDGWERWQRPTSDNPVVPAAEIEAARREAPRFFVQEYLAQFTQTEGAEWPAEYFPESLWFTDWPAQSVMTGLALDPSMGTGERAKGCYAAFAYGRLDSGGVLWVEAWLSQSWDSTALAEKGLELYRRLLPQAFVIETTGAQRHLAKYMQEVAKARQLTLPLWGVDQHEHKEGRIRAAIGPELAQGHLRFRDTPDTRLLVQQLRDFPVGEFVDGADALEMLKRLLATLIGQRPNNAAKVLR